MTKTKKWTIALVACVSILFASVSVTANEDLPFSVDAEAAVLLDFHSNQILYAYNKDNLHIPASLVKVMTMFVAFDRIDAGVIALDDTVIVSENAWRMTGSQMFLEVDEVVTVDDLLQGIAVVSGNDACVAIAEAVAGSQELFVRWMNETAARLDLDLTYTDVHGLSADNLITAESMAQLVREYILAHPNALEYHQQRSFSYQPRSMSQPIVQYNRNRLLGVYEGADGLKTGFLSRAGYNLVATAERDGRRLIAVVLGAPSEAIRQREAVALLNYGFRNFQLVAPQELLPQTMPIYRGETGEVRVIPAISRLTIPRGQLDKLFVTVDPEPILAPVQQGETVGQVTITLDGEILQQVALLADEDVARGSLWRVVADATALFFRGLFGR